MTPSDRPRILVVDDEPANRRLLCDLVAREGFEPIEAPSGREALAKIDAHSIDLVLLDLMMPEVDGMRVLAELGARGKLPELSVVVVTAHDDRKRRIEALSAGAVDFVTKPIDRYEIACRIRTLVELRRLRERALAIVEDQLRETDHLLRLRFMQAPVAKIVWDMSFRVIAWNPAAEKLFGYSRDEAVGRHAEFIVPEAYRDHAEEPWRALLAGHAHQSTNENMTKHKRTIICEWHNAPLTSTDGKILGVSSVVIDVTERAKLQEALAQTQKIEAMGQLAGGVAHDFNNILAVILSYGSFLRDTLEPEDERREDVVEILNAAKRAAALTKQLLAFSRKQPTEKRPVDLNHSLGELQNMLARTLGPRIDLKITPSAKAAIVRIDPVQFDQIALNLAVNARDAMPDGGELRITLEHPPPARGADDGEAFVHLVVSDSGHGMDEATSQRIFEPFFTTKKKGSGTGLGLATCFGIVADAGGEIRVDSRIGEGTTFTVRFPLCPDGADSGNFLAERVARTGQGEVVLLAEDDDALRRASTRVLESAGYSVHVAENGDQAVGQIDRLGKRLAAVLTDAMMPGRGGYDVAAHAKRVAPDAAVILTSGFVDDAGRHVEHGNLPVLWKPVAPRALVQAVANAIAAHSSGAGPISDETTTRVLVFTHDEHERSVLSRALAEAGFVATFTESALEVQRAFSEGREPDYVLCDVSYDDDAGAELLRWIVEVRPSFCARVIVLLASTQDLALIPETPTGAFRVLSKPVQPRHITAVLGRGGHSQSSSPEPSAAKPQRASSRPPERESEAPALRKERILLVDDDDQLARASQRALSDEFDVNVAGSLAAARALLQGEELDLLLLDVTLPDGSGLDLLSELRGQHSDMAVVMMTGALSNEVASRALHNRVTEYLPKPFLPAELRAAVQSALETGRIARVRSKLLAARLGGDEFVRDLAQTEKDFARALPRIRMVFQPIVRASDTSVFGYEALLRCDEPTLASPPRLLGAAEVLGRVEDVGRAVRAGVAKALRAHPGRIESIFVNLHPSELQAALLSDPKDPLLAVSDRIVLEVTERASLGAGPKLDEELKRIRALGYRVAVDDLGEGYAGLASLVHVAPDIAKIDMSLVRDIHTSPLKQDIVAALVDMARRSGIVVVAEGIETVEERNSLVGLGCDLLQGYLFAKPGPPFPVPRMDF